MCHLVRRYCRGVAASAVRSVHVCRVFRYRWTVNWRMLPERVFLDQRLSQGLLAAHVVLLLFFAHHRWLRGQGGARQAAQRFLSAEAWQAGSSSRQLLHPRRVLLAVLTSNFIGIVCARSLHYQFYSWYFHSMPFLLWQTRLPVLAKLAVLLAVECCWNVFPATAASSAVLLGSHVLLLASLWFVPALQ
jgi:alpha-1,3-mannosyltransferase